MDRFECVEQCNSRFTTSLNIKLEVVNKVFESIELVVRELGEYNDESNAEKIICNGVLS